GFYTWLFRIAHNAAISRRRRRRPRISLEEQQVNTGDEPASGELAPENAAMRTEQVEQVRDAIDQLPDDQRDILVLREIEGFCYEEIARVLDLAPGTVRSRLHRARARLRELLGRVITEPSME
ncbi:MAG TPA: sigma-70 family RNA polymerase sigma factor, partial [Planctomycetaceae bacterium]|nr:sigma-70 family RNA polymerase sigma factor [Planctomycetaceae bacterium]